MVAIAMRRRRMKISTVAGYDNYSIFISALFINFDHYTVYDKNIAINHLFF